MVKGFFDSRWVKKPEFVQESSGLPKGFRASAVACGLKASGKLDLGLIVSDSEQTVSAACFADSAAVAPPVRMMKQQCDLSGLRAVVVNAGNANAATGDPGLTNVLKMQDGVATGLGLAAEQVGVASTGVIGQQLPMDLIDPGIQQLPAGLDHDGSQNFAEAITTTDIFLKTATIDIELSSGTVRLSAQAKGAGMISPRFATMLCFIESDVKIAVEDLDGLMREAVDQSFERVSVDGQLSTNDTVVILANGESGVEVKVGSSDYDRFSNALKALMRQLAVLIVRDGEGSKRVGRVTTTGGPEIPVEEVSRAIANSPLVKAALFGGDPNWGRILQAVGMVLGIDGTDSIGISIEGVQVCSEGKAVQFDQSRLDQLAQGSEIEYEITLPGSGSSSEVFFSDLSYKYVEINSEYTT